MGDGTAGIYCLIAQVPSLIILEAFAVSFTKNRDF